MRDAIGASAWLAEDHTFNAPKGISLEKVSWQNHLLVHTYLGTSIS